MIHGRLIQECQHQRSYSDGWRVFNVPHVESYQLACAYCEIDRLKRKINRLVADKHGMTPEEIEEAKERLLDRVAERIRNEVKS